MCLFLLQLLGGLSRSHSGRLMLNIDAFQNFPQLYKKLLEMEAEADIIEQLQNMLAWKTEADVTEEQKTDVLTEKLIKLLRYPETIVFDCEDDQLWVRSVVQALRP